jgi:predicted transposase YdaD
MLELERTRAGRDRFAILITYMFQIIDPMDLDELHAKIHELSSRSEEVAITIAEYLREQGRKKGLEEGLKKGIKKGRQEGRQEGCLATLRNLLVFKFQTLGARYEARLQAASPEAIDRYFRRLLTADSLAKVFED